MRIAAVAGLSVLALVSSAQADFVGQIILGPLGPGSVASGDITFSNDDNDGWTSGTHIFNIWDGGDDAWALDWPGGDLSVDMVYSTAQGDPDLFLYEPGSYDDSGIYSIGNSGLENVSLADAPAGRYYLVVDCTAFTEAPYQLSVGAVPAPSGLALLGVVGLAGHRRRR